ncbi:MAG: LytTR family DNA-binding domain-containing protein [Clostridiaceae bacterium]|nr:LytTR family DNA-binding domain-containing protein [Clostridiaceae bacterium]
MRIAVCDDEKAIRKLIGDKVRKLYPQSELLFFESGEELLARECQLDILFLDIQMPGRNGMETARELRRKGRNTILVFVTAIEEYVFQAFDVGAFHYLVKPFTDEKFHEVMASAVSSVREREDKEEAEKKEKYMMVSSGGSHIKILLDDIVYAEVFNRKIIIHKRDSTVEYYGKLSDLEKSLGEDFFRPHRAYLIHFKYVMKYNATSITMENGSVIMAKAKFPEFVKKYLQYNRRKGKEIV